MHAKLLSKLFNENFWSVILIKIVFKLVCLPWKKHILFFSPRETFKVCWIKIYLAAATAFLRCHYFCCPSHFSYFLAFCSLYFRWNNLGYKVFIVLEILVQSLYILAIRLLGIVNFSIILRI